MCGRRPGLGAREVHAEAGWAREEGTRGPGRREAVRATAPGAFPPLPFAPGEGQLRSRWRGRAAWTGPAGAGIVLPALPGSRKGAARVGRHPGGPVVGSRGAARVLRPLPAFPTPAPRWRLGARASAEERLMGGLDPPPIPGWKELRRGY